MTKDEALDLALDALESVLANHKGAPVLPWIEARDAIKQARALDKKAENARELGLDYEPVECPVCKATDSPYPNCGCVRYVDSPAPVQESVATVQCINGVTIGYLDVMQPVGTKLYTTPPAAQRQWVGLTDEERDELLDKAYDLESYAVLIEAKLRERNT